MSIPLTTEQEAFLEECALEFSDRFTDADLDYKKIYESGIPTPPIMCPWQNKRRFNSRDRGGYNNDRRNDGRYYDRREDDSSYRRNDGYDNRYRDRHPYREHKRFSPY